METNLPKGPKKLKTFDRTNRFWCQRQGSCQSSVPWMVSFERKLDCQIFKCVRRQHGVIFKCALQQHIEFCLRQYPLLLCRSKIKQQRESRLFFTKLPFKINFGFDLRNLIFRIIALCKVKLLGVAPVPSPWTNPSKAPLFSVVFRG